MQVLESGKNFTLDYRRRSIHRHPPVTASFRCLMMDVECVHFHLNLGASVPSHWLGDHGAETFGTILPEIAIQIDETKPCCLGFGLTLLNWLGALI